LLVFVILFPLALLSANLKFAILKPDFFKQTFRQIDFYKRLVNIDAEKAKIYIEKKMGAETEVPAESIRGALNFISPEDLQYTFEKNLDSYLASASQGKADFAFDLSAIKKSVATKKGDPEIKELLMQLPDSYTPTQTNKTAQKVFSLAPFRKILSYVGYFIVLSCLVFSFILWPGWRGKLRLLGVVLLIFGALILILRAVFIKTPIPTGMVADFLDDIFRDILAAGKLKLLAYYLWEGVVMVAIGAIMMVASFIIKSPQGNETKPVSP